MKRSGWPSPLLVVRDRFVDMAYSARLKTQDALTFASIIRAQGRA